MGVADVELSVWIYTNVWGRICMHVAYIPAREEDAMVELISLDAGRNRQMDKTSLGRDIDCSMERQQSRGSGKDGRGAKDKTMAGRGLCITEVSRDKVYSKDIV